MSRSTEDRLAAALHARAEQVTPQVLAPIVVPRPPHRARRGALLLLAAAASTAAVVTPFVLLNGGEGAPEPDPAGTPSVGESEPTEPQLTEPQPTQPSDPPPEPGTFVVVDEQQADVDGDGRPDQVRVLFHSRNTDEPAKGSVEVTLAAGGTTTAAVPLAYAPQLLAPVDLNGDGGEQLLLPYTEGGDAAPLAVYTWHDGALVRARQEDNAPLATEYYGAGPVAGYYVDERGLISWYRLGDPVQNAPRFRVKQWSWSIDGDRLVPTSVEPGCLDLAGYYVGRVVGPAQSCAG